MKFAQLDRISVALDEPAKCYKSPITLNEILCLCVFFSCTSIKIMNRGNSSWENKTCQFVRDFLVLLNIVPLWSCIVHSVLQKYVYTCSLHICLIERERERYSRTARVTDNYAKSLTFSGLFPLISTEFYPVTILWNLIEETIPTNGHNIGIGWEIGKLLFERRTTE